MVSVDPCITEDNIPINESAPYFVNISFSITKLLDPEIGLNKAKGSTYVGKDNFINIGLSILHI